MSLKSAKAAVRLAAALGAKVTAYHAIEAWEPQVYAQGYGVDLKGFQAIERAARESGERYVAAVAKLADTARVRCTKVVQKTRTPYEAIGEIAGKSKCDLIVMASHGRRGVSKLMMGSVTQKVLARATVPVLVYR